jgi:hypothetical protein
MSAREILHWSHGGWTSSIDGSGYRWRIRGRESPLEDILVTEPMQLTSYALCRGFVQYRCAVLVVTCQHLLAGVNHTILYGSELCGLFPLLAPHY